MREQAQVESAAKRQVSAIDYALRWIGHTGLPGRHRIVNALSPRNLEPRHFETAFYGLRFVGDVSDAVDRSIFYYGFYSPAELDFIDKAIDQLAKHRRNIGFFDIGANTGQHSLFASRKPAVTAVHAFEPSRPIADRFETNIRRNAIEKIVLHRLALSDADGTGELGSGFPGNSGSRSLNWTLRGHPTETVIIRAAGQYLDEHKLPRIDFLKLDVELHEKKVLRGLSARIVSDRPVIMMEFLGETEKAGFASAEELRESLYPGCRLLSLGERRSRHRLLEFDWNRECVAVLPEEIANFDQW